jgi:hypothetical protein
VDEKRNRLGELVPAVTSGRVTGVLERGHAALMTSSLERGNRWQPTATDFACFHGFREQPICR